MKAIMIIIGVILAGLAICALYMVPSPSDYPQNAVNIYWIYGLLFLSLGIGIGLIFIALFPYPGDERRRNTP